MTEAMLVATPQPGQDPEPAATIPFRGGTVLGHLRDQLVALGVTRIRVLARPRHAASLRAVPGVEVVESSGVACDLRRVAGVARTAREPLVVASATVACHREALAGLLSDPAVTTAALVSTELEPGAPPVRIEQQRLVSAGSRYHRVTAPNAVFLGVARVDPGDAEALAGAADQLTALAEKESLRDVTALLLVGLVRSGAAVAVSDTRMLRCRQIGTPAGAARADAALRAVDEDSVVLGSAVRADDGVFATYCVNPYSKHLVRWSARRGVTPNTVTAFSALVGLAAAGWFALGSRAGLVIGAVLLQVAFATGCVDGQLARYTRNFSALGGRLGAILDRAKEYVAYAGLAIGAAATGTGGVWALAVAALGLQTVRHLSEFSYTGAQPQPVAALPRRALDAPGDGMDERADGTDGPGAGVDQSGAGADECGDARGGGTDERADGRDERADGRDERGPPGGSVPAGRGRRFDLPTWVTLAGTRLSRRFAHHQPPYWLGRVAVLPAGERFALISITAALGGARVTFVALLVWGGLAGVYTLTGRVLRSLGRSPWGAAV